MVMSSKEKLHFKKRNYDRRKNKNRMGEIYK